MSYKPESKMDPADFYRVKAIKAEMQAAQMMALMAQRDVAAKGVEHDTVLREVWKKYDMDIATDTVSEDMAIHRVAKAAPVPPQEPTPAQSVE